jgi:predicted DCC family thiol-disulfide oxidoreductase YuxK
MLDQIKRYFPLLLFDGECILCNRYVNFILNHQSEPGFYFSSLQSPIGQLIKQRVTVPVSADSLILITGLSDLDQPVIRLKSAAVLYIVSHLKFPWSLFAVFRILPDFILDSCYVLIAAYRYKVWGRTSVCQMTVPEYRHRFIYVRGD